MVIVVRESEPGRVTTSVERNCWERVGEGRNDSARPRRRRGRGRAERVKGNVNMVFFVLGCPVD